MHTKRKGGTMKYLERLVGRPLTLGGLIESIRLGEEMSQTAGAVVPVENCRHALAAHTGREIDSTPRPNKIRDGLYYGP